MNKTNKSLEKTNGIPVKSLGTHSILSILGMTMALEAAFPNATSKELNNAAVFLLTRLRLLSK